MNRTLRTIIWKRNKLVVMGLSLLLIGYSILFTATGIHRWQENYKYQHSEQIKKDYANYLTKQQEQEIQVNETYKKFGDAKDFQQYVYEHGLQGVLTYHKETDSYKLETSSFKDYSYRDLNLVPNSAESGLAKIYHSGYFLIGNGMFSGLIGNDLLFFFAMMGFLTGFLDYKTNFLTVLFSSKFKRKAILNTKVQLILTLTIVSVLLAMVLNIGGYYLMIPHQYLNINLEQLVAFQGSLLAVGVMVYFLSLFGGIICGQSVTGGFSIIAFYGLSTIMLQHLIRFLRPKDTISMLGNGFDIYTLFPRLVDWLIISSGCLLLAGIVYYLAKYFHEKLSLENRNHYILIPSLRLPISLFSSLYTTIVLFENALIEHKTSQLVTMLLFFLFMMGLMLTLNYYQKIVNYTLTKFKK